MSAILIVVSVLLVFLVLMMFKTQKKLEAEIKSLKKELENKEETEMYLRHTPAAVAEEEEAEHEHFTLHEEVMHLLNLGTDKTEISEKLNVPQNKIDLIIKFDKIKKEKQYS